MMDSHLSQGYARVIKCNPALLLSPRAHSSSKYKITETNLLNDAESITWQKRGQRNRVKALKLSNKGQYVLDGYDLSTLKEDL